MPSSAPLATRRAWLRSLAALAGAACLVDASPVEAAPKRRHGLVSAAHGSGGVTLTFRLEHAPFPHRGASYHDDTVVVFVPYHYRLPKSRKVDAVVHFHGHNNTVKRALVKHRLREQLTDSLQNAILIAPQGPVNASDGSGGKLETKGGLSRLLSEVVRHLRTARVARKLGKSSTAGVRGVGMVCLSAHSGGYRVTAACLRRGGVNVNEVYLFDALYGHVRDFERWIKATKGKRGRRRHKLISHYAGGAVRKNNLDLLRRLERGGMRCAHETGGKRLTRAQLVKESAIFIASPLSHGAVTFQHNNLRDCLYASGLKRRIRSRWFRDKDRPRAIESRAG